MVKKSKDTGERKNKRWGFTNLGSETKNSIYGLIFFGLGIVFLLAGFKKAGPVGEDLFAILSYLIGFGYFLIPTLFFLLGISFLRSLKHALGGIKTLGGVLFFLSGLALLNFLSEGSAGIIGSGIETPLQSLFDVYATFAILIIILAASILILFDLRLELRILAFLKKPFDFIWRLFGRKERTEEPIIIGETTGMEEATEEAIEEEPRHDTEEEIGPSIVHPPKETKGYEFVSHWKPLGKAYTPPPLSLLEKDKGRPGVGDIKANANIIKRTLQNFGIIVEMDEISIGPSVTRYALKPAEGVKLSRIVALQNDLSLALAAHPIRIEAPIPGKSLVGIEIPNTIKSTVGLATLLSAEEFQTSDKPLYVALGRGISGKAHFGNLGKMPHLLVAGATGSGKSVTIHTIITSLLYRNSPENLRLIMIDPKRVELTLYNKIPHLLTPVITDAKKTILALKWAAKEMDRRYDILESESVRDVDSYHKTILRPALEKLERTQNREEAEKKMPEMMPYIVIIIDELADIMGAYPRELEASIVRLAQMSRAVGIHLILSTQRPSVNIITGLIKANIPARIALQVSSQIDSRTILDGSGAEKLLGAGDMLYLSGEMSQPSRLQSAFISETEVKRVVKYLSDSWGDEVPHEINFESVGTTGSNGLGVSLEEDEDDELYEEARGAIIQAGKASTSYLQRKLGIGYARAARLIDILEERGVVGPGEGAKPREVFGASATQEQEEELF